MYRLHIKKKLAVVLLCMQSVHFSFEATLNNCNIVFGVLVWVNGP